MAYLRVHELIEKLKKVDQDLVVVSPDIDSIRKKYQYEGILICVTEPGGHLIFPYDELSNATQVTFIGEIEKKLLEAKEKPTINTKFNTLYEKLIK